MDSGDSATKYRNWQCARYFFQANAQDVTLSLVSYNGDKSVKNLTISAPFGFKQNDQEIRGILTKVGWFV
jgi:hypothetical protein